VGTPSVEPPTLHEVTQVRGRTRVGWELARLLQETLVSLEQTASRVLAAEVAGAIALWTQLYTFEEDVPEAIGWIALLTFIVSICVLGLFIRPRRIIRFWDRALPDEYFAAAKAVTPEEECRIVEHVCTTMRSQRDTLEHGIRVSIPLGVAALFIALIGYIVDKLWYGG
jgi:hypothetical protein